MFKEGICIDDKVCDQTKVENARKIDTISNKDQSTIFCPNYSTTRLIFKFLDEPSQYRLI